MSHRLLCRDAGDLRGLVDLWSGDGGLNRSRSVLRLPENHRTHCQEEKSGQNSHFLRQQSKLFFGETKLPCWHGEDIFGREVPASWSRWLVVAAAWSCAGFCPPLNLVGKPNHSSSRVLGRIFQHFLLFGFNQNLRLRKHICVHLVLYIAENLCPLKCMFGGYYLYFLCAK